MQFLQMAQQVRQRVGMQGTGPSSISATGYEALFIALIKDCWEDLQNYRTKWKWMRDTKSFLLSVGVSTYTPATIFGPNNRFKDWYKDTCYVTVGSQKQLVRYIDYDIFTYRNINNTTNSTVSEFTIRPKDYALCFNLPDSVYTITIDYKKNNQELINASDEPECPEDYHLLLVYEAVARYSLSMSLGALYQEYSGKAANLLGSLLRSQNQSGKFKLVGVV